MDDKLLEFTITEESLNKLIDAVAASTYEPYKLILTKEMTEKFNKKRKIND